MNRGGGRVKKKIVFFRPLIASSLHSVNSKFCYFNISGRFIEKECFWIHSLGCFLPLCLGEDKQLTSEMVLDSNFFSSCFFWFF